MADTQTFAAAQEILLKARIKFTTGTAAQWTAANPVLLDGEVGFISGTSPAQFKIGDGTKNWSALGWGNVTTLAQLAEDASHRLVTDAEKTAWNAKAEKTAATTSADGLMSAADKAKLNGITAEANNYTHPASHSATMITEDATHRFATDAEKMRWNGKADVFTFNELAYHNPPTDVPNPQAQIAKDIVAAVNAGRSCVVIAKNVTTQEFDSPVNGVVTISEVSGSTVKGLINDVRMASGDGGRTVFLATASITFKSDGTVTVATVPYTGNLVLDDNLPAYSTEKAPTASGFAATYYLTKGGTRIGVPINIPLDQVLKSSSVKSVTVVNVPYAGAKIGDKYIEFLFQNSNTPQYLPAQSLVDIYTGDNTYIEVTSTNVVTLKYEALKTKLFSDAASVFDPKGAGAAAAQAAIDEFKESSFVIQCTIPGM